MDELYKNLVKLKPKDNVPFKCIGCGECCKHVKEQVPVETLDAFRIARYLMEQDKSITCMDDFWERFAEPALLDECGYFVYSSRPKDRMTRVSFLRTTVAGSTLSIRELAELTRSLQVLWRTGDTNILYPMSASSISTVLRCTLRPG